jgi:AbrB family looped-hinge helix DNA binding protein
MIYMLLYIVIPAKGVNEMFNRFLGKGARLYGSVTVGERGQVVIPAEARRDLNIVPNSKLLVFTGPHAQALMMINADSLQELLKKALSEADNPENSAENTPDTTESGRLS